MYGSISFLHLDRENGMVGCGRGLFAVGIGYQVLVLEQQLSALERTLL